MTSPPEPTDDLHPLDDLRLVPVHVSTLTPEIRAYYQLLGRFVTAFSLVEKNLFSISGLVAGLPLPMAQAMFGGSARVKDSIDRINKAIEVQVLYASSHPFSEGILIDLAQLFAQIGVINGTRNDIFHHGTDLGPGEEWNVNNSHLAFKPEKVNAILVSPETLADCLVDLEQIVIRLSAFILRLQGDHSDLGDDYRMIAVAPWRYKLKRPVNERQTSQSSAPKPKRQPRPSRG